MNNVQIYSWKHNLWNSKVTIFADQQEIGVIQPKFWSALSKGNIADNSYELNTKHSFVGSSDIRNASGEVLGHIDCWMWRAKATLLVGDRKYQWKKVGFFSINLSLRDAEGREICRGKKFDQHQIIHKKDTELLLFMCAFLQSSYARYVNFAAA